MKNERTILAAAVVKSTTLTPRINAGVVKAQHGPHAGRRAQLAAAIASTQELLAALQAAQRELGWKERDGAAA